MIRMIEISILIDSHTYLIFSLNQIIAGIKVVEIIRVNCIDNGAKSTQMKLGRSLKGVFHVSGYHHRN